jgi:hypothetical protein
LPTGHQIEGDRGMWKREMLIGDGGYSLRGINIFLIPYSHHLNIPLLSSSPFLCLTIFRNFSLIRNNVTL